MLLRVPTYLPVRFVLSFIILSNLFIPFKAASQSSAQIKREAESRLREMSPEEIDRKLREYGMSREEAVRRAREMNISLEDFLSRPASGSSADHSVTLPQGQPTIAPANKVQESSRDTVRQRRLYKIPGISEGRGVDTLQPFGMDVFGYPASAFEAVLNIASPPSYLLGPGDEIIITVWGETKLNHQLSINREGNIIVPDVGPVSASGVTLAELKQRLLRRMSSIYSGLDSRYGASNTFLDVSLGKLRTIQVFVLGEVENPGGFAISSFGTAFNALYLAGGPTVNGTMREVQVMRKGEKLVTLDIYDYVLRGDNSRDHRLQDGDIVFVPPAGKRVAITGAILRPAIYEVRTKETLGDLISLCGGLRFDAYFNRVHIQRIIPFEDRAKHDKDLLEIDVRFTSIQELHNSKYSLADGDVVSVYKIGMFPQNRVSITGNVNKPGNFELRPGMTIRDLIFEADSLQRNTFAERGTLFRTLPNFRKELRSFNPRLAIEGDDRHNLALMNEDSLVVYSESQFFPQHTVTVSGAVRNPGTFMRAENMSLADLIVLAGGLREGASFNGWEISRIDTTKLGVYSKVHKVDVSSDYWHADNGQKFLLQDFDFVSVPFDPRFTQNKLLQITGYVMNPGVFAIRNEGERLSQVVRRAGGLRPGAYLEGSRIVRRQNQVGVIPIDFKVALSDSLSRDNIVLKEGDSIHVAYHDDVVYVSGEVFVPSAILYKKGEGLDYYIRQAGGLKQEADEDRIVAFLPSGKKWEPGWFFFSDPELPPGSRVIIPKKVEKEDKTLPLVRDLATIIASLAAITVAVVQISR